MTKYIAVEQTSFLGDGKSKHITLFVPDKVSYTPPGWHEPYKYSTLEDISHSKINPAKKRVALVHIPGCTTSANNARVVSSEVCQALDDIDNRIADLRRSRAALIRDNFRTFQLLQQDDVELSSDRVHSTRQDAEKARAERNRRSGDKD